MKRQKLPLSLPFGTQGRGKLNNFLGMKWFSQIEQFVRNIDSVHGLIGRGRAVTGNHHDVNEGIQSMNLLSAKRRWKMFSSTAP